MRRPSLFTLGLISAYALFIGFSWVANFSPGKEVSINFATFAWNMVRMLPFAFIFEERWPMILGIGLGFGIPLIQLPIHLFITPLIMKKRASKALDTLIHNIIILARQDDD